jgi:RHS repeat-associated protein
MKKYLSLLLSIALLFGWAAPQSVQASGSVFSGPRPGEPIRWNPDAEVAPEPLPQPAEILTPKWLSREYQVPESTILEQAIKGYPLTQIRDALKSGVTASRLESALTTISPQTEKKWNEINKSIIRMQQEQEIGNDASKQLIMDEKIAEILRQTSTSRVNLSKNARVSASPERITESISSGNEIVATPQSKGMSTMSANATNSSTPPLPNLASNYDQAAAGLMNVRTDQAPFNIANGGESVSTLTGELTIRNTDMTLPGRNGLSFSLDRVYNSSDAKYYKDDVKWRIYQRKWFYPVVNLYIESVDANGIHHSSGLGLIPLFRDAQYVLYNNIYWEFIPPAMFGFEYNDENNLLAAAQAQMMQYQNQLLWTGYREAFGTKIWYAMIPTGQVIEIPIDHENLIAGYQNKPTTSFPEENRYPIGKGWSWDISHIKFEGSKRFLSISGVGTYEIASNNTLIGYPWKDLTFGTNYSVTVNGKTSAYVLSSISGIKQYFSSDGKLIRIADNYGNTIDFTYSYISPYGEVLTKVTDALQNTIQIAYTTTQVTITSGDRTVIYNKGAAPGNKEFLGSVTDAGGRTTYYGYQLTETNYNLLGSGYEDGENYSLLLNQVYHPTGAHTDYTYGNYRQLLGNQASGDAWYVTKREDIVDYVDAPQERANLITFSHSAFPGSTYGVDTTFTSTVNDGLKQTIYTIKKDFIDQNTPAVYYTTSIAEKVGTATKTTTQVFDETRRLPVPIQKTTQFSNGTTSEAVTISASYDDYGNLLSETSPLGVTSTYVYDNATRLLKNSVKPATAALNQYTEYTRNAQGSVTSITVRENHAGGALKQHISFAYDAYGNVTQVTIQDDNRQTVIAYEYGSQYNYGYPTKQTTTVTDVNGQTSVITQLMEYDKLTGQLTKLTDGKGYSTSFTYDKLGRVTKETLADGSQIQYAYNDVQNFVTVTDMLGQVTQKFYNPFGWLKYETLGLGYASYGYDQYGRMIWSEDAKRQRTQYQYDGWRRLTRTTHPDNSYVQKQYDDVLYTTTTIDENGNTMREVYDKVGRLLRTEEVKPTETVILSTNTYDNIGNLASVTDARGNTTSYGYDVLGRLISVTDPENRTTQYTYSMANNLIQIRYPDNRTTTKVYDEIGRLIQQTNPDGQVEKFKYDANNNLVQFVNRKGGVITYSYNNRNFLTSSSTPGETVTYTYDAGGKRLSMTDATGTTQYSYYNDTARLKDITFPDGTTVVYDYDVQSLESQYVLGDSREEYAYDARNRLVGIQIQRHDHFEGNNWFIYEAGRIQYTYNANSTLSGMSVNEGLFAKTYAYDGLNLSAITYKKADQTVIGSFQYSYDNNRNIVSRNENGQIASFTYDALNRIQTSSLFNESYQYDTRGNRLTLTSDLAPTVPLASYEYDDWDRLVRVTPENGTPVEYRYNGDGMLWERVENGVTTRYYYNERGQLIREGTVQADGSVTLTARYIYNGASTVPIARDDIEHEVVLYYVTNGHGDVMAVVDGAGNIVNEYSYDIWGNPLTVSELVHTPFRYSGEYWDDTTGLQYLRARWYDPSIGRFINEDTYEGDITNPLSLNLYIYVLNNPLRYIDPSGFIPTPLEAAKMADHIYYATNRSKGVELLGGWVLEDIKTNKESLKIGIYYRDKADGTREYALVNKGTTPSSISDWINNIQQPVGFSTDEPFA